MPETPFSSLIGHCTDDDLLPPPVTVYGGTLRDASADLLSHPQKHPSDETVYGGPFHF